MPDTYVKLPNGKYVQIPEGASPEQLQQLKSKLVQMQVSPESQAPDALAQARQVISKMIPQKTERAMQQTMGGPPMFTDVPEGQKQKFEEAGKKGYATGAKIGMALSIAPTAIAAPVATALGVAGGAVGSTAVGYAAKKGAAALGASPYNQETAEDVGGVLGGWVGGLAGSKLGAGKFGKSLTASKDFGGKMLEMALQKGGDAPIELSPKTNEVVEQITEQGGLGGKTPKVVTDLLKRLGPTQSQAADAQPGPLTYREARIIQKQLSDMSANEKNDLSGDLKWLIPKFAKLFSGDVQAGTDQAGIGDMHRIGMMEYAAASARNRVLNNAARAAKPLLKGGLGAIGAGSAYELYRMLTGQR